MPTIELEIKIDSGIKGAVEEYCRQHNESMSHFMQEALIDRLEELQDIQTINNIRSEPTKSLGKVLSEKSQGH